MNTGRLEQVQQFIRYFVSAVSSTSLYSPGHRHVLRQCDEAFASLLGTFAERDEIILMVIENELIFDTVPLDRSMYISRFIQFFVTKGIEHLKISRTVEVAELRLLIEALAGQGQDLSEVRTMRHISLKRLARQEEFCNQGGSEESGLSLEEIAVRERGVFREIQDSIGKNETFCMDGVEEIVFSCILAFRKEPVLFPYLSPLLALDTYTFTHSTNVCALNLSQAMMLGIQGRLLHDIGIAGFLHDIGKLFVPREILAKPEALSEAEREIVSRHPIQGAHYLLETLGVPKLAVVCAFEHHMRYDGAGYPVPAGTWQQNVCSQMTAISDFFDALRTKRAYRGPVSHDKVAALLADGAGTRFNPELTRSFLGIMKQYRAADASSSVPQESSSNRNHLASEQHCAAGAVLA